MTIDMAVSNSTIVNRQLGGPSSNLSISCNLCPPGDEETVKQLEQQNLLIDADDTLWENNVYFERVIEEVKTMLAPFGIAPELFRKHLDALERKHIAIYGYGTLNFTRSLLQPFEELVPSGCDLRHRVESLGLDILNRPLEIIARVPPTLVSPSR